MFGAAGLGDLLDVAGDGPGVEVLVGIVAIDLAPAARGLGHRLLAGQHRGRHRLLEGGLGSLAEIAREAEGADLVLHLHHQHGVLLGVDLLEMLHQRSEGALVGLECFLTEGGQAVAVLAGLVDHAREAPVVELDPGRRVLRAGVLPGAEPQQHDAHLVLAGLLEQGVDEGEIEAALDGLDLLPGHWYLDGVGLDVGDGGPDLVQGLGVVAGVVDLGAEDGEGLAVD